MGYRSDVLIAYQFKDKAHLVGFLTVCRLLGDRHIADALKEYSFTMCGDFPVMYGFYEGVKWYDHFEEVKAHHSLLDSAAQHGVPTLFIRIGEDTDDAQYEEHGTENDYVLGDYFNIHRYISVDVTEIPFETLEENDDESKRQSTAGTTEHLSVDSSQV